MKLYNYQEQYLAKCPASCIMAADLGTGKTLMSLAHWERHRTFLQTGIDTYRLNKLTKTYSRPLLVVAPASKIRTGDWESEARRWFGDSMPDITYISYESLRLMDKETKRPRWWKYTGARNGGVVYDVIADECHALKNPQSKQSKAIYEITQSGGLFIGLSGTPMPNGWIDFAGYSKIFGFTKGITEFKNTFCRIQDFRGYPEIIGYSNVNELQRQLKSIAFRLSREQSGLPPKQMIGVNIHLPPKDIKLYLSCRIERKHPNTGELLDSAPRLLSVLRQSTTNARLDSLLSIVDDTNENIVLFYNYISERKAILKALAKTDKHILRADGEKHDKLPASDADIKNTILVAHYKSASTGLNLQWASVMIFFSPSYSYQDFEQAKGRIFRTGQTKRCLYYLFSVKNTVDRDIWNCLKEKQSFNKQVWYDNLMENK